jgi:cytochrome c
LRQYSKTALASLDIIFVYFMHLYSSLQLFSMTASSTSTSTNKTPSSSDSASAPASQEFSGDVERGARIFRVKCGMCHTFHKHGMNRSGPNLFGIMNRPAGSARRYGYTAANANSGIVWTPAALFKFLANPRAMIPGTKMVFRGLRSPQDRCDVIAFLQKYTTDE